MALLNTASGGTLDSTKVSAWSLDSNNPSITYVVDVSGDVHLLRKIDNTTTIAEIDAIRTAKPQSPNDLAAAYTKLQSAKKPSPLKTNPPPSQSTGPSSITSGTYRSLYIELHDKQPVIPINFKLIYFNSTHSTNLDPTLITGYRLDDYSTKKGESTSLYIELADSTKINIPISSSSEYKRYRLLVQDYFPGNAADLKPNKKEEKTFDTLLKKKSVVDTGTGKVVNNPIHYKNKRNFYPRTILGTGLLVLSWLNVKAWLKDPKQHFSRIRKNLWKGIADFAIFPNSKIEEKVTDFESELSEFINAASKAPDAVGQVRAGIIDSAIKKLVTDYRQNIAARGWGKYIKDGGKTDGVIKLSITRRHLGSLPWLNRERDWGKKAIDFGAFLFKGALLVFSWPAYVLFRTAKPKYAEGLTETDKEGKEKKVALKGGKWWGLATAAVSTVVMGTSRVANEKKDDSVVYSVLSTITAPVRAYSDWQVKKAEAIFDKDIPISYVAKLQKPAIKGMEWTGAKVVNGIEWAFGKSLGKLFSSNTPDASPQGTTTTTTTPPNTPVVPRPAANTTPVVPRPAVNTAPVVPRPQPNNATPAGAPSTKPLIDKNNNGKDDRFEDLNNNGKMDGLETGATKTKTDWGKFAEAKKTQTLNTNQKTNQKDPNQDWAKVVAKPVVAENNIVRS